MIELLAKNNNSDSVTNKKCPKLMSERGFSEIIFFFNSFFDAMHNFLKFEFIFGVAIQSLKDFLDLTSKLNGKYTKQLTIIIDTKIRFLRVAHDELQNFLAALKRS